MKFNSQICTSREQSESLLALGLKKETADMKYVGLCRNEDGSTLLQKTPICKGVITENNIDLPAWSLHRLIEMRLSHDEFVVFQISQAEDAFEKVISHIEHAIKDGYFNKEYLQEQADSSREE